MSDDLVSVIIAVADGTETIGAAIRSLQAQSHADWEAVIVSDDGRDYRAVLAADGIVDDRLVFTSTGGVLTGCAAARNVGLGHARGAFVTRLDADDVYAPGRLARLVPLARRHGASADNLEQVDLDGGGALMKPFPTDVPEFLADFETIGALDCPVVPLVRRDHVFPWYEDADIAEDVIFALRLVDAVGRMPVVTDALYEYRIRLGSMCHGDDGAERADRSYAAIMAGLTAGRLAGIGPDLAARMNRVFARKRALNLEFGRAYAVGLCRTFPQFRIAVNEGRIRLGSAAKTG